LLLLSHFPSLASGVAFYCWWCPVLPIIRPFFLLVSLLTPFSCEPFNSNRTFCAADLGRAAFFSSCLVIKMWPENFDSFSIGFPDNSITIASISFSFYNFDTVDAGISSSLNEVHVNATVYDTAAV
jgi:hypothetical protein